MNFLALNGRNWAIRIFASVLLISIYTIVSYNIVVENVETKKITQQVARFVLTLLIAVFVLKGKRWAVMLATILFSIAAFGSLVLLFGDIPFVGKIPIITMVIIYSAAVYHLNFSKGFKEFLKYKNLEA